MNSRELIHKLWLVLIYGNPQTHLYKRAQRVMGLRYGCTYD